jgi:transcriptional regulator with XRE-family HTH domain
MIDRHVGIRLRIRRCEIGLSQSELGERLGVTFQQIQKYERGANRLGASRLYDAARMLQVDVAYFFHGLNCQTASLASSGRLDDLHDFIVSPDGLEAAKAFRCISRLGVRRNVIELMRALG